MTNSRRVEIIVVEGLCLFLCVACFAVALMANYAFTPWLHGRKIPTPSPTPTMLEATPTPRGYGGIGIFIAQVSGRTKIVRMMEGSPAEKAGLKIGDIIVAVDGRHRGNPEYFHWGTIQRELRGAAGTSVVVSVEREGLLSNLVVTREWISEPEWVAEEAFLQPRRCLARYEMAWEYWMEKEIFVDNKLTIVPRTKEKAINYLRVLVLSSESLNCLSENCKRDSDFSLEIEQVGAAPIEIEIVPNERSGPFAYLSIEFLIEIGGEKTCNIILKEFPLSK